MTTVTKDEVYSNFLPAGQKLTVVTAANSTATVERYNDGDTLLDTNSMSASATLILGPYFTDCRYKVKQLTGSSTATNSEVTTRDFLLASDVAGSLTTVGVAALSTDQTSNLTTTQLTALCANMDVLTLKLKALEAGAGY